MTFPDSMFLLEVIVEELNSYIKCKEFHLRVQFANVFTLNLKDPNEVQEVFSKALKQKNIKKRIKVNKIRTFTKKAQGTPKVKTGKSILFTSNVNSLISNMKMYPMQLFLWDKDKPEDRIGSTNIPWNTLHIDYLNKVYRKREPTPSAISGEYNVFNEITSKRMATVKLNIKLSCLKDRITTQFRSLSEDNHDTFLYTGLLSKPTTILSTVRGKLEELLEDAEPMKSSYISGKLTLNELESTSTIKIINSLNQILKEHVIASSEEFTVSYHRSNTNIVHELCGNNKPISNLINSRTEMDKNNHLIISKCKSCSSINRDNCKMLDYIFGDYNGSFGNKVYCAGYFTVENDFKKSKESSRSSLEQQSSGKSAADFKGINFQISDNECPNRKLDGNLCSKSSCSLESANQIDNLINITKCKQVNCDNRDHSKLQSPPDDRIFLDRSNFNKECCDISEKVEQIVGEMKAKMKFEGDPCYCSCECTFGFTKKTTYCAVCGGYEKTGEDLAREQRLDMPFPCPTFHKLVDKNKLKTWSTSGSSAFSKRKADESQRSLKLGVKSTTSEKNSIVANKSAESGKDAKKGKKKDDRFKFNYGYQGIRTYFYINFYIALFNLKYMIFMVKYFSSSNWTQSMRIPMYGNTGSSSKKYGLVVDS